MSRQVLVRGAFTLTRRSAVAVVVGVSLGARPGAGSLRVRCHGLADASPSRQRPGRLDRNGSYLLRRAPASFCRTLGYGYVPLTIQGSGEYSAEDGHRLYTSGRMHCWPKRGGRQLISDTSGEWWFHPSHDVLAHDHSCFWRKGTGSPANCRALYRGLPLPAEKGDVEPAETPPADE